MASLADLLYAAAARSVTRRRRRKTSKKKKRDHYGPFMSGYDSDGDSSKFRAVRKVATLGKYVSGGFYYVKNVRGKAVVFVGRR